MKSTRGITLLELLIATAIMAFLMLALARTYAVGINYDSRFLAGRDQLAKVHAFEDKIITLIQHAELAQPSTPAEVDSYFIGNVGNVQSTAQGTGTPIPAATVGQSSAPGSSSSLSDTLILTVSNLRVPSNVLNDSTSDFETQNQKYGPQGGITEYAISCTPVGSPPGGSSGCYIRRQSPADDDPSQGGTETLLSPDVTSINFEFFDGTQYDPTWDSRQMTPPQLPACVRVTYQMMGQPMSHVFTVIVPNSNVTTTNPVVQTTTAATP